MNRKCKMMEINQNMSLLKINFNRVNSLVGIELDFESGF